MPATSRDGTCSVGTMRSRELETGNCSVTIVDEKNNPLAGVTTSMTGLGDPIVEISNAQGKCIFILLPPGDYSLECQLAGYSTFNYPDIVIKVGRDLYLEVILSLAVPDLS